MKKESMENIDGKVIIHEFLVANLKCDFSQYQLLTNM